MLTNFSKRLLTSIVLIPSLVAGLLWFGSTAVEWIVLFVFFASVFEWSRLVFRTSLSFSRKMIWISGGVFYLFSSCYVLWALSIGGLGHIAFLVILCLAWISDSAGYLVGKPLGGPKLYPKISPGKTWSGAIGSVVFTAFLGGGILLAHKLYLTSYILGEGVSYNEGSLLFAYVKLFFVAGLVSVVGQLGDLLQSWAKRSFGVKDSGRFFPGHGGILDRLDAVFAIALFLLILATCGFEVLISLDEIAF